MEPYNDRKATALYADCWNSDKKFEPLISYLEPFVAKGNISAVIQMARIKAVLEHHTESENLILKAENLLKKNDFDGRVDLWNAYRAGLGAGTREDQDRKALEHLYALAHAGNLMAQEILMMDYLNGTNGVSTDILESKKWVVDLIASKELYSRKIVLKNSI